MMEDGEPPDDLECIFCHKRFSDKSNARKHMQMKRCPQARGQVPPTGGETCETCGTSFSTLSNLQKHIRCTKVFCSP